MIRGSGSRPARTDSGRASQDAAGSEPAGDPFPLDQVAEEAAYRVDPSSLPADVQGLAPAGAVAVVAGPLAANRDHGVRDVLSGDVTRPGLRARRLRVPFGRPSPGHQQQGELGADGAGLVGAELPPAQDHLQPLRRDRGHGLRTRSALLVPVDQRLGIEAVGRQDPGHLEEPAASRTGCGMVGDQVLQQFQSHVLQVRAADAEQGIEHGGTDQLRLRFRRGLPAFQQRADLLQRGIDGPVAEDEVASGRSLGIWTRWWSRRCPPKR
ncbi:hypothetical protein SAURM35S_04273 [Streptomyces aurantiogriseus]